mmetsp:Transcript_33839/g.97277  ORF Transcript_33839/g.97277 Transcript_33839/m.97277 type:complete len:268 (+) Transcript_33839:350-1153(+)
MPGVSRRLRAKHLRRLPRRRLRRTLRLHCLLRRALALQQCAVASAVGADNGVMRAPNRWCGPPAVASRNNCGRPPPAGGRGRRRAALIAGALGPLALLGPLAGFRARALGAGGGFSAILRLRAGRRQRARRIRSAGHTGAAGRTGGAGADGGLRRLPDALLRRLDVLSPVRPPRRRGAHRRRGTVEVALPLWRTGDVVDLAAEVTLPLLAALGLQHIGCEVLAAEADELRGRHLALHDSPQQRAVGSAEVEGEAASAALVLLRLLAQ